jgi:hypothetical protein
MKAADALMEQSKADSARWEQLEQSLREENERLKARVTEAAGALNAKDELREAR